MNNVKAKELSQFNIGVGYNEDLTAFQDVHGYCLRIVAKKQEYSVFYAYFRSIILSHVTNILDYIKSKPKNSKYYALFQDLPNQMQPIVNKEEANHDKKEVSQLEQSDDEHDEFHDADNTNDIELGGEPITTDFQEDEAILDTPTEGLPADEEKHTSEMNDDKKNVEQTIETISSPILPVEDSDNDSQKETSFSGGQEAESGDDAPGEETNSSGKPKETGSDDEDDSATEAQKKQDSGSDNDGKKSSNSGKDEDGSDKDSDNDRDSDKEEDNDQKNTKEQVADSNIHDALIKGISRGCSPIQYALRKKAYKEGEELKKEDSKEKIEIACKYADNEYGLENAVGQEEHILKLIDSFTTPASDAFLNNLRTTGFETLYANYEEYYDFESIRIVLEDLSTYFTTSKFTATIGKQPKVEWFIKKCQGVFIEEILRTDLYEKHYREDSHDTLYHKTVFGDLHEEYYVVVKKNGISYATTSPDNGFSAMFQLIILLYCIKFHTKTAPETINTKYYFTSTLNVALSGLITEAAREKLSSANTNKYSIRN